jgi:hypothetical protein
MLLQRYNFKKHICLQVLAAVEYFTYTAYRVAEQSIPDEIVAAMRKIITPTLSLSIVSRYVRAVAVALVILMLSSDRGIIR